MKIEGILERLTHRMTRADECAIFDGRKYSCTDIAASICKYAAILPSTPQKVGIRLRSSAEQYAAITALIACGHQVIIIPPDLSDEECEHLMCKNKITFSIGSGRVNRNNLHDIPSPLQQYNTKSL